MSIAIDKELPKSPLLRWGAYAGALTAIGVALAAVWAITGNDAPPLASINRVEMLDQRTTLAENKTDQRVNTVLGILSSQSNTMLQIQLHACQRDRAAAGVDLQHSPNSAIAHEALAEADDCVRSLARQINRPQ